MSADLEQQQRLALESEGFDMEMKILLVGDAGVGKTSLLTRFVSDAFYDDTLGDEFSFDFKVKPIDYKGKKIKLYIWDTAGQERFRTITSSYYRGVHGVFIVYAVDDAPSFNNLKQWIQEVHRYAQNPTLQRVMVGNKSDMDKKIDEERGKAFAQANSIPFYQTSAKTNSQVTEAFMSLVGAIVSAGGSGSDTAADSGPKIDDDKPCCLLS
ncbi:Small GTPase superfamily [Pelomyxa schiedti]|nr:Small GTPase superfamily [Pelomyxa schiedti]